MHITTLGIDLAKHVFQLHGADARGRAVLSRRVKRIQLLDAVASLPPCVIGMEACGSAHHWGRACEQLGHTVKLMNPKYVRPSVKTNKNDGRDAEAICEAVSRPAMRFVSIKTVEQADMQAVHRTRSLFVKHRNAVIWKREPRIFLWRRWVGRASRGSLGASQTLRDILGVSIHPREPGL